MESFFIFPVVNIICARAAQLAASKRGRSSQLWMWLAVILGPITLGILVLMPRRIAATDIA